jgi:hypothetical protein
LVATCGGRPKSGRDEAESRTRDARQRFIGWNYLLRKTVSARVTGIGRAGDHPKGARTNLSIGQMTLLDEVDSAARKKADRRTGQPFWCGRTFYC